MNGEWEKEDNGDKYGFPVFGTRPVISGERERWGVGRICLQPFTSGAYFSDFERIKGK